MLKVERIDHGVRSEANPALMHRLARSRVPLTVCPLSNVKLRVFPDLASHNLKRMLDAGVNVTINSDDPAYFGGYVGENYIQTAKALGLGSDDVLTLARNSLESSFVSKDVKANWVAELSAIGSTGRLAARPPRPAQMIGTPACRPASIGHRPAWRRGRLVPPAAESPPMIPGVLR